MKAIIVLTFDFPTPEHVPEALLKIDPPTLPYFSGQARIAFEESADAVVAYLDDDEGQIADRGQS